MSEGLIVAQCLEWLALHRIFAWRNNTGSFKTPEGRYIQYGHKGSGDILGVLPIAFINGTMHRGVFLAIECKTIIGKQSQDQKLFQRLVERSGGMYLLVNSAEQLATKMKEIGVESYGSDKIGEDL